MPKFRATLRVSELIGSDPAAAQRTLEEKLRQCGLEKYRILGIESEGAAMETKRRAVPPFRSMRPAIPRNDTAGLLLVAAAAWTIWLVWYILE